MQQSEGFDFAKVMLHANFLNQPTRYPSYENLWEPITDPFKAQDEWQKYATY